MTAFRCWSCDGAPIVAGEELEHCRYLRHEVLPEPNDMNADTDNVPQIDGEESKKQISKVIDFAKKFIKKIVISSGDSDKAYALVSINNHDETIELSSTYAKRWVKVCHFEHTGEIFSDQTYHNALELIKSQALFNEKTQRSIVHKRTAFENGEIHVDLCTPDWKLVKISRDSIAIVSHGKDTPMFQRSKNQSRQVEPVFNFTADPMTKFCKLIRVDNPLFIPHLISLFIENAPIPIMAILGQQGSIKSTQCGLIKRVIDPSGEKLEDNLSHLPRSVDDVNVHFAHNYVIAFDNVSYISDEMSDTICKAITGASYPKRMLYTDAEEIILKFHRKIIINGISVNIDRGDLVERTIQYSTNEIPQNERKTAKQVEDEFSVLLPELLGKTFLTLQKVLQLYDSVANELKDLPRMADFAVFGETISRALGNPNGKFLEDYTVAINQSNDILSENNALIPFLEHEMETRDSLLMSAGSFYENLSRFSTEHHYDTKSKGFPKGPNKLRGFFERSKPLLKQAGFRIDLFKNSEKNEFVKNSTIVKVAKIPSPSPPSSLSSTSESIKSELSEDGEHPASKPKTEEKKWYEL